MFLEFYKEITDAICRAVTMVNYLKATFSVAKRLRPVSEFEYLLFVPLGCELLHDERLIYCYWKTGIREAESVLGV